MGNLEEKRKQEGLWAGLVSIPAFAIFQQREIYIRLGEMAQWL